MTQVVPRRHFGDPVDAPTSNMVCPTHEEPYMHALIADVPMKTTVNYVISDCEQESSSAPEYGEKRV